MFTTTFNAKYRRIAIDLVRSRSQVHRKQIYYRHVTDYSLGSKLTFPVFLVPPARQLTRKDDMNDVEEID